MPMTFLSPDWCKLRWSPFVRFDADRQAYRAISCCAGVYRVRVTGRDVLAYVGQTGRMLRERLNALRLHTLAADCPWNDPHTAAPKLWSYRQTEGAEYECSWAEVDGTDRQRKALECYMIWQYRLEVGASPLCNFGRLHPNYRTSRGRSTADRGGRLPDGQRNPSWASSVPPLRCTSEDLDARWMGLVWSSRELLSPHTAARAPTSPGVYRVLDAASSELLYIGQSSSLRKRLQRHARDSWGRDSVVFSYSNMDASAPPCQRLEIENDLIAGYYATARKAPTRQFSPRINREVS